MKRSTIKYLQIIISALTIGSGISCSNTDCKIITLKCHFMAYACGDCLDSYVIDSVLDNSENISRRLIHKEIQVEFTSNKTESDLNRYVEKCSICYDYYFTGKFQSYAFQRDAIFHVDIASATLRDPNCCQ